MEQQTKTSLPTILSAAQELVSQQQQQAIQTLAGRLQANTFTLAVLGQFKRGKTSFINALLGEELLPTAVIPLTSIITILKYGQRLEIKILFNNGKIKDIELADLPLYVTEKHNPKNEKGIHHVEISHPSPYLQQGMRIVDTPGIASTHGHNTQTTYEFLPQADAGIFVVSVDPPITQAEFEFLNEVKGLLSKLFFVQNKIDTISQKDWQESLEFSKEVIQEHAGLKDVHIFPLSAKLALEAKQRNDQVKLQASGLPDFETALNEFVIKDKEGVMLKSIAGKTFRIVEQEILLASIKLKSSASSRQELENKLSKFNASLAAIQKQQVQDEYLLKGEIQTIVKTLEKDLENLKMQAIGDLAKSLEQWHEKHKHESTKGLAKILDAYIGERIQDIFAEWKLIEENKIKRLMEETLGQFSDRVNAVTEQILGAAAELFGLTLDKITIREKLSDVSRFSFKLKEDVQVSLDTLSQTVLQLLPGFIGRKIVTKQMTKYAADMVDRHCGRLRYDFVQRIDETQRKFKTHLRHDTQSLISQITQAIQLGEGLKNKTKVETEQIQNVLQAQLAKLSEVKQQLKSL